MKNVTPRQQHWVLASSSARRHRKPPTALKPHRSCRNTVAWKWYGHSVNSRSKGSSGNETKLSARQGSQP
eukprot:10470031-Prorocentrum_lima.AAC.1